MNYNRVTQPRAYMDRLSFDLATGRRTVSSNYSIIQDDGSTAVTFDGGQFEDLFDMRPSNYATIAHDTKKFYIQVDTGMSSDTTAEANFCAILGHNLKEATGMFRVVYDDSSSMASANSATASTAVTGVINATQSTVTVDSAADTNETLDNSETTITTTAGVSFANHIGGIIKIENEKMLVKSRSGNDIVVVRGVHGTTATTHDSTGLDIYLDYSDCIEPANNGWTLITWANNNTDNRYYRIEFLDNAGAGSNFADDVKIGSVLLGEYHNFSSPSMELSFNVDYDGSKLITSAGGNTFAQASALGSPQWASANPWALSTEATQVYKSSAHYGRRKYNMNFSHVADTDLFLSNMRDNQDMIDGSDLYSQFFHKSLGIHQPFLWSIDKDSTSEGDYGLFRLANGGLQTQQVSFRTWDTSINLVEHW